MWSDYNRDSVACRKTYLLRCIPKMWLSHVIEKFDSSDGRTRSRKPTPLSQKPIFWAFHWNGNNFWLDKTDSVVIWNGFVSDRFLRPSIHKINRFLYYSAFILDFRNSISICILVELKWSSRSKAFWCFSNWLEFCRRYSTYLFVLDF